VSGDVRQFGSQDGSQDPTGSQPSQPAAAAFRATKCAPHEFGDECGREEAARSSPSTTTEGEPAPTHRNGSVDGADSDEHRRLHQHVWHHRRVEQSSAVLVTAGIATQSNTPAEVPEVRAIGATSHGYLVAGSVNGGCAVWRSVDLESFEPVYSEVCCERYLRASSIAEFGDALLIGGTGEFRVERTKQAFILRSDEGGASWAVIDDPLFTSDSNRVDRIIVTDDGVLVENVDDRGTGQPESVAAWSDDLTTWRPVELPGRQPEDWPWFALAAEAVFAISQRNARHESSTLVDDS